jgi:hypothetical protein
MSPDLRASEKDEHIQVKALQQKIRFLKKIISGNQERRIGTSSYHPTVRTVQRHMYGVYHQNKIITGKQGL